MTQFLKFIKGKEAGGKRKKGTLLEKPTDDAQAYHLRKCFKFSI